MNEHKGELRPPLLTAFEGWRDDIHTGSPPVLYLIGSGELAIIEIGPKLVTLIGGAPGAGKTAFTMQGVVDALRLTPTFGRWFAMSKCRPRALGPAAIKAFGDRLETIRYRRFAAEHGDRLDQGLRTLETVAERLAFVRRRSIWKTSPLRPTPSMLTCCA